MILRNNKFLMCLGMGAIALLAPLAPPGLSQFSIGISVSFGPPAIPVYEQPVCPNEGYLWVPGYWAYDPVDGYFWVPGTWVAPPRPGFLWTPGWWGWSGSAFAFHEGYWGPHVGFYGGINYGFGYTGSGYYGGRWQQNRFYYNTNVNHVNTTIVHNTYNTTVNNITVNRISYNGGSGGITARPTPQEQQFERENHVPPVSAQAQQRQQAHGNPELRAQTNQGRPPIAATARAGDFQNNVIHSSQAGGEYRPPPAAAARPANPAAHAMPAYNHANDLQQHQVTAPNTADPKRDQRYQQQQQQLVTRQNQDHQRLQQQQERQHQQASQRNLSPAQQQQMEQRHTQQTQQMEQRHAARAQQLQQRQAPREAPKEAPREQH